MEHGNLEFYVYEELLRRIVTGELGAGEHVVAAQVAEELAVSRTPVIGALQRLAAEGLLQKAANRGFFVAKHSLEDMLQIYEAREGLESVAARVMAERGDAAQIAALREIADALERGRREQQIATYSHYDFEFHRQLVRGCGNRFIATVTNADTLIVMTVLNTPYISIGEPWDVKNSHGAIVKAIEAGDTEGAEEAARAHLQEAKVRLEQMLRVKASLTDKFRVTAAEPGLSRKTP